MCMMRMKPARQDPMMKPKVQTTMHTDGTDMAVSGRGTVNPMRKSSGRADTSTPRRGGAGGMGSRRSRSAMG